MRVHTVYECVQLSLSGMQITKLLQKQIPRVENFKLTETSQRPEPAVPLTFIMASVRWPATLCAATTNHILGVAPEAEERPREAGMGQTIHT